MLFSTVGAMASGGWDALNNILTGVGKGASAFTSPFFPAPQKTQIKSEIFLPAANVPAPSKLPENISMVQTTQWRNEFWRPSPYAQNMGPADYMRTESLATAAKMGDTKSGPIEGLLGTIGGIATTGVKIRTAVDEFMQSWGLAPRETVIGTPRAGYPEGRDDTYWNDLRTRGAQVATVAKGIGSQFLDQIKGLMGIGYTPTDQQPVFAIQHDIQPSKATTIGLAVAAAIILFVIFTGRKK